MREATSISVGTHWLGTMKSMSLKSRFIQSFLEYYLECKNKHSSCIFLQNSHTNHSVTPF